MTPEAQTYLERLVFIYMTVASLILLVMELGPAHFVENKVLPRLPLLRMRYGKALMLIMLGSLCFDSQIYGPHEHVPNTFAGIVSICSGFLSCLYYFLKVEASPSDYRGFQHPSTDLAVIIRQP